MQRFPNNKIYFIATFSCLVLLLGSLLLTINLSNADDPGSPVMSQALTKTGYVSFSVMDGDTYEPLSDINIIVLETEKKYTTDKNGSSEKISVPIIYDTRFDNILKKNWGEITVVFYKEGYTPYALFYLQVMPDEFRENVEILMFGEKQSSDSSAFSIIEGPRRDWVNSVVEKYLGGQQINP